MKELLDTGIDTSLGYSGRCDALVGKVKDLAVVIKENNETKSYGCLIWVKKKNSSSDDELYSYLSGQVADKPHIIKHFKTTGRGAALALVKYNDPSRNIKNLNRFLGDLADDLYAHDYVNCCYACGATEDLGIYASGSSVVQYCANCRKGTLVQSGDEPADDDAAELSAQEQPEEQGSVYDGDLMEAMTAAAVDLRAEETAQTVEDLLADPAASASRDDSADDDREVISTANDSADLSGLFAVEEAEKEPAPKSELFEAAQREFEEERRKAAKENEGPDETLDGLMFSASDAQKEKSAEPAFGEANVYIEEETDSSNLEGLMYDENDAPENEPEETEEEKEVENANIYGLMLGSEQEVAEAEAENGTVEVTEVTAVTAVGMGSGEDLTFEAEDEEEEDDGSVEVTEIYDDSNEGDDIEIEELSSDFNMPTDTKGGEIEASETPLEADGSVPMVNPKSDFAETKPSSVHDPNAVRAFAYGSYEGANVAEEPVGFDGRRKGDRISDPRLGDEMGSVSRDYKRQNAAATAPGAEGPKPTGFRVVSKGGDRSRPVIKKTRSIYSGDSNAVVGVIAAVLFGIIGCALWCGIGYMLGLMDSFDKTVMSIVLAVFGCLPAVAVFLGYRIGGDCFDTKGIVIASVLTVILDAVGLAAVLIVGEMQSKAEEIGYNLPIDKAAGNVMQSLSDPALKNSLMLQLGVTAVVMVISLVAGIVIAKKRG